MKLIGFNFSKIHAERFNVKADSLNVKSDINLLDISSVNSEMIKTNEDLLAVKFSFSLDYSSDFAKIEFIGSMVVSTDSKKAKDILKGWKDKKAPDDFQLAVYNIIIKKSSIKALELEEELGIPIHIPLPSLKPKS